jgi:hypothetical protein
MPAKKEETGELVLRVRVVDPPTGIHFCIQGKIGEFLQVARSGKKELVFETTVRIAEDGRGGPRLLGRSVQGPPDARFLYIGSGALAGDKDTPWQRRAKVPLTGITNALLAKGMKKGALEATIAGKARDGGPACATVPLLRAWTPTTTVPSRSDRSASR